MRLKNVNVMSNSALMGGGLYVCKDSKLWLTNRVWIVTNSAFQAGGACVQGQIRADHPNVFISHNQAVDSGGGLSLLPTADAVLSQAHISDNRATGSGGIGGEGGGISVYLARLVLRCGYEP